MTRPTHIAFVIAGLARHWRQLGAPEREREARRDVDKPTTRPIVDHASSTAL